MQDYVVVNNRVSLDLYPSTCWLVTSDRRTGGITITYETCKHTVMNRVARGISDYNECFDCGKIEYLVKGTSANCRKLAFKIVNITIEMPNRLDSIRGGQFIALCPRCFDMMNTDDF